ncbi:putative glutamine amidotransferase [Rhizomicrobium palustre]|uniref:gamma-glutamyl-gamma-aminobutyrate hydrolase n=2 Tax=Rhizomicrobium palustre TaxID=189966 RepID=A0A846MZT8_9PROT|nr:gamma-glutamyl-gamma-aminobutyrate hydrolase family protein [Rhizomicrobium palustre]NIK88621.1 putative glutamine amidotransferase [Rhizomicrobium palustre]
MARPVVGLICDRRRIDDEDVHLVLEQYITTVRDGAGALPLLIPVLDTPLDADDIFASVDGLLFTGSPSNVEPLHYGGPPAREPKNEDKYRDRLTLNLIRAAIEAMVPSFCICRGLQELNVALGGTLYQQVQEVPGRMDHREDPKMPEEVQWGPSHDVTVTKGGMLDGLLETKTFAVNSLHGQGIDRLAPPLREEAHAPDGQIEAVSLKNPQGFLLAVQWHPEWRWAEDAVSRKLWQHFAETLR